MSQHRPPLSQPRSGPDASDSLSPSDHVRMLVELLRPATPELARRWLAALLLVPESERAAVVAAVERQITETYERASPPELDVVHPPTASEGYVEQVVVTYAASTPQEHPGRSVRSVAPSGPEPGALARAKKGRGAAG